jgi:hypothetical protein
VFSHADFVVRVAGLDASALDGVRCERTYSRIVELLATSEWLKATSGELGNELYGLVPVLPSELKPRLVALRRKLYQTKPLGRLLTTLAPDLPQPLVERAAHWDARREQQRREVAELSAVLNAELPERVEALRRVGQRVDLQLGLVSTCPDLYVALRPWLRSETLQPPQRHSLISLARYVARMSAKTSPRTSFTAVGLGRWVNEGPAWRLSHPWQRRVVIEPQGSLVQAVRGALARDPRLLGSALIRWNPSAVADGDRLWWVSQSPNSPLLSLRLNITLRNWLTALSTGREWKLGDLEKAVLAAGGQPGAEGEVEHFVRELVRLGLFEPRPPIPDQSDDWLHALWLWLEQTGHALPVDLEGTKQDLAHARQQLMAFAATTVPDDRLQFKRRADSALRRLAERHAVLPAHAALPDGTVFFDSMVLTGPVAELNAGKWRPTLQDLDIVRRALALFDPKVLFRLGLTQFFDEAFGAHATVPYLALLRELSGEGSRASPARRLQRLRVVLSPDDERTAAAAALSAGDPRLNQVVTLRRRFVTEITSLAARADGVIDVPRELMLEHISAWPAYLRPPESISVYAQIDGQSRDSIQIVLNGIDTGYGRGRARVRRLVEGSRGDPVPSFDQSGDGALLVELDSIFGNSVNLRCHSAPYTVDFPGLVSDRPAARTIPLAELVVEHRSGGEFLELVWPKLGQRVRLVYTATIWELLLPPASRLLMDAFAEPATFLPPHSWWLNGEFRAPPSDVEYLPRIVLGHLTLRRACWATSVRNVPRRRAGEHDAAYLFRLAGWVWAHKIPDRCFVRVMPAQAGAASRLPKHRKPMFFDVGNWFLAMAFERSLGADDDLVFFTEQLPPLEEAVPAEHGEPRVVELVLELTESRPTDG